VRRNTENKISVEEIEVKDGLKFQCAGRKP